jgi:hypothetical protein
LNRGQSFSIYEVIDGLTADPQLYCHVRDAQKIWLNSRNALFPRHEKLLFSITKHCNKRSAGSSHDLLFRKEAFRRGKS